MSQLVINGSANASLAPLNSSSASCEESSTESISSASKFDTSVLVSSSLDESKSSNCPEKAKSPKPCPDLLSAVEAAILRSCIPIDIKETEQITVLGQQGIWANRCEVINWNGPIPITEYSLNEDAEPQVIYKKVNQNLEYIQELAVRYLKPSTPPPPGEIIITQEPNLLTPPAPPVIIRQQPPRPCTPKPLVIRESPPKQPPVLGRKLITISGKQLPPPPRKVVIERLPPLPTKPQPLIVERWLPYRPTCKRRVIFQHAPPDPVVIKPRNVLVQWSPPEVSIRQEIKYLGIVKANPFEYEQRYGDSLRTAEQLPSIVTKIQNPEGIILAAEQSPCKFVPELEGEIEALKLVDLEAEGLSEYKSLVFGKSSNVSANEKSECPENLSEKAFEFSLSPINSNSSNKSNCSATTSETNNTTIIVNSSPIAPALDTSKLASPVSMNNESSAAQAPMPLNAAFSPCTNPEPKTETPAVPVDEIKSSKVSISTPKETSASTASLALDNQSTNLVNTQVFNESNLTLTSALLQGQIDQLSPIRVAESSLINVNPENTSLFSNLSPSIQGAPSVDNYKVVESSNIAPSTNVSTLASNNVAHSTIASSAPNSMQSNEFTLVTPSIPPMIPGTPVSSVLSSRLSLKSTSIALISASASATSVSTMPTTTLNASTAYGSSNFPSTSSNAYQSSHYISTAYPSLTVATPTLNSSQAELAGSNFSKEATTPGVLDTKQQSTELTPKLATPASLIKTPAPVSATPTSTMSSTPVAQSRSNASSRTCKSRRSVADSVIERLFTLIDINGDGAVSIEEAERIFMKLNTRLGRNYGSDDVKIFFKSLDPAGTGKINIEQFKKAFPNRI